MKIEQVRWTAVNGWGPEKPGRLGASAQLALIFDPVAIFGVDIFAHDRAGNPRPLGGARDMGMFEDQ